MSHWLRRIRALVTRRRLDDELAEEIRQHLELRRQQLVEAGMEPEQAACEAHRMFGNATAIREQTRDLRSLRWLDTLAQDLRYGARLLWRSPAFTIVAVMSLAVGIGSAAAVFNVADAVLFRPLAVDAPHELRRFHATLSFGAGQKALNTLPQPMLLEMQRLADFADLVGFTVTDDVTLAAGRDAAARIVRAELVSTNYFEVLGVPSVAGRVLGRIDERGDPPSIVVSEQIWRGAFAADPSVVGRTVTVNGHSAVIAGVARGFRGLMADRPSDIFLTLGAAGLVDPAVATASVRMVARLRPGVSTAVAEQRVTALFRGTAPTMWRGDELRVELLDAGLGVSDVRAPLEQPLLIGLTLVGVLLLVACANTGGLLLARFAFRRGEFAIRVAIGAGRARLVRQLVAKSLLLAAIAAVAGLVVARLAAPLLLNSIPIGSVPADFDLRFDWRLIFFTAGTSSAAALLAAAASLVRLLRADPSDLLRAETRSVVPDRRRLTHALIAAQVACSLLLLVGAGSMARSLINLRRVEPGFDLAGVLAVTVDAFGRAADAAALRGDFTRLQEQLASAPHVEDVSIIQFPLLTSAKTTGTVDVPGFSPATDDDRWVRVFFVGPRFFEMLRMPVISGRGIEVRDNARGERVTVVNQQFARFYFGQRDLAIGRTVNRDVRIVGVVADARYNTLRDAPVRAMFVPFSQAPPRSSMTFLLRAAGDPELAAGSATAAVRAYDPQLKMKVTTLADYLASTLSRERFVAVLAAGFSGLALFLACAGLYGTVSYAISERRSELAVRLALGATASDIARLMLKDPLRTAAIGVVAGVPAVYVVMRTLSALLFGVSTFDVSLVLACAAGLLVIAAAAAVWPARRALTIDPLECLKCH